MIIIGQIVLSQHHKNQLIASNKSPLRVPAQDVFQKLDFKLYPNPLVGDLLNFISPRSETKEIAILNILGEEVFKVITLNNQIQLPSLNRGIYIVKLKQGNYLGLSRFVVP
jgi:hypothetical protein